MTDRPLADLLDAAAALLLQRPTPEGLDRAARFFGYPREDAELALEDFNALFFVPVSGRYLPPLESVFRENRLSGQASTQALTAYRAAGFDPAALVADPLWGRMPPPDHLGVELAFVCALLRSAQTTPGEAAGLAASAALFHARHVAPWAGDYGRRLIASARSGLYRRLGKLLVELADQRLPAGEPCPPTTST